MSLDSGSTTFIVLTPDQMQALSTSTGAVELRDPSGKRVGVVHPHGWTEEDLAIVKQRRSSQGRQHTVEEVTAHLESLEPQ